MNIRSLFTIGFFVVSLAGVAPARADTTELKFGHVGSPGSLFAVSAEEFAKRANEKLGGKYKVVVFGSSQLGGDSQMMQKVKLGTLDFALPSTVMSSVVPAFGLFEMPYLVKDREQMKRIERDVVWPKLAPLAEKQGYHILAVWENGFRQITNNKHPINVPDDLKGIKLRVPKGKWRVKMFQAYGANPSAMGLSETFAALQTGTMDGEENPLTQIYTSKFQEVQKYLSLTDHVYTPAYVVTSAQKWKTLPADVRKVLEDTAKEIQPFVYQTAAKMDNELLGKLKAAGMQVNRANKQAFVDASKPIYQQFAQEVPDGKDMIAKAQASSASATSK
jgi:tripartite ATP-independent transporter DctP family solute receptor